MSFKTQLEKPPNGFKAPKNKKFRNARIRKASSSDEFE